MEEKKKKTNTKKSNNSKVSKTSKTKKVKNENYTGVGEQIGENTNNSTAGYTGTGTEYIWKELDKISDISSESTEETLTYNLPSIKEGEDYYLIDGRKFNWTKLYGTLGER